MPYQFSNRQKVQLHDNAPMPYNPNNRAPAWESNATGANVQFKETRVIEGVTVQVYAAGSEPRDKAELKMSCLKKAIRGLQNAGLMWRDADVAEFRVTLYGSDGGTNWASRGVVWFNDPTDNVPTAMLQLGTRICQHVMAGDNTPPAGGATTRPPRVVADRLYDYYKSTYTKSENENCALAQIYHEFGHIFHQLSAASEYWLGVDVFTNIAQNVAPVGQEQQLAHRLVPLAQRTGTAFVSQYAGCGQLNEFVAEVFSGMMMGVDWRSISGKVMELYTALNGPMARDVRTISRMQDFINQRCICEHAGKNRYDQEAKIIYSRA